MKPSHTPLIRSPGDESTISTPPAIIRKEKPRPSRAAKRVARVRSPVRHQAIGARDPAAVEREAGDQVEHQQERR